MNEPLMDATAAAAIKRLSVGDAVQGLQTLAWSVGSLKYLHIPLLQAIASEAIRIIKIFRPSELTNPAWAVATRCFNDSPFCNSTAAEAIRNIRDYGPPELSKMAWAFATIRNGDQPLLDAIAAESIRRIAQLGHGQNISRTAWSFATLQMQHLPLLNALSAASLRSILAFNNLSLRSSAWVLAKCELDSRLTWHVGEASSPSRAPNMDSRGPARAAWSTATTHETRNRAIAATTCALTKRTSAFGAQSPNN